jgi:hypothetical protein
LLIVFQCKLLREFLAFEEVVDVHTIGTLSRAQFQLLLGAIMSATVCNVFDVMLRTPGESIIATAKMRRIVFTFDGFLNVNERAINRGQKCSKQLWVEV